MAAPFQQIPMLQMSVLADDVFVGPRGLRCDHGRYVAIQLRRVSVRNRNYRSWLTLLDSCDTGALPNQTNTDKGIDTSESGPNGDNVSVAVTPWAPSVSVALDCY